MRIHSAIVGANAAKVVIPVGIMSGTVVLVNGDVTQLGFDTSRFTPESWDSQRSGVVAGLRVKLQGQGKLPGNTFTGDLVFDLEYMLAYLVDWGESMSPALRAWRASGGSFDRYVEAAVAFIFDLASAASELTTGNVGFFNSLGYSPYLLAARDWPHVSRGRRFMDLLRATARLRGVFQDHPAGYFESGFSIGQYRDWLRATQNLGLAPGSKIWIRLFERDGGDLLPAKVLAARILAAASFGYDVVIWEYAPRERDPAQISHGLAEAVAALG